MSLKYNNCIIAPIKLTLLIFICGFVVSCGDSSKHHGDNIVVLETGSVRFEWPSEEHRGIKRDENLVFLIPSRYEPSVGSSRFSFVYELKNLSPWLVQPSLSAEAQQEIRAFSFRRLFGLEPSEAEVDRFLRYRERQRARKYIRVRSTGVANSYESWISYSRHRISKNLKRDLSVGGLDTYSRERCFSEEELIVNTSDTDYLQWRTSSNSAWLAQKPANDPSPPNCRRIRQISTFTSPPETPLDELFYARCERYEICHISFQVRGLFVQTYILSHDMEKWQETVDPIREVIESFSKEGTL